MTQNIHPMADTTLPPLQRLRARAVDVRFMTGLDIDIEEHPEGGLFSIGVRGLHDITSVRQALTYEAGRSFLEGVRAAAEQCGFHTISCDKCGGRIRSWKPADSCDEHYFRRSEATPST